MSEQIPILEIDGLTKAFGGLKAVDKFSMSVAKGERHGILGPNGAGKTTVYNLVCGVYGVTSGTIKINGRDVTRAPIHARARLGIGRTFQITNLFQELTVLENVLLATTMASGESRSYFRLVKSLKSAMSKAEEELAALGLEDLASVAVSELGYGQQRQLEVALALALEPAVLMLDEPTAGLSQAETNSMVDLIHRLPTDLAMVMIEHDLDVIFGVVDQMTVMHRGKVICAGDCEMVRRDSIVSEVYIGQTSE